MDTQPPQHSPAVRQLVEQALALPPTERAAFLDQHCADDQMRRQVEAWLEQGEQTQDWGSTEKAVPRADAGSSFSLHSAGYETLPTAAGQQPSDEGPIGQIGDYELLAEIARGGMGVVYKARHRVLDRLVAIKIPRASQLEDEGEARFLREARSAAQLRHPHICPIYEVGHAGRQPFIALGFIDGPTLRQWLRDEEGNARVAAEIIAKVARAVHYAHEQGVIHRDIKPSNIMLDGDSREPMLMDFGLAKQLSDQESHVTKSGQVMGTPVYMAPEQAAGHHEKIGPLSDVYALGAVLYELLTGRPPYAGSTGEVIRQVQSEPPPAPRKLSPSVHRDLETICLKAMAKEPAARYADAAALAEDLQRFCAGEAILARREGVVGRSRRALRRHWRLIAAVLLVSAVAGGLASYFAFGAREAQHVTALTRQFNEHLRRSAWGEEDLAAMESLAGELSQLDPRAAAELRTQLHDSFARRIGGRISNPAALSEADIAGIEADIEWLAARAPNAVPPLRERLQARLRTWQPVVELAAPFDGWQDVFADDDEDKKHDDEYHGVSVNAQGRLVAAQIDDESPKFATRVVHTVEPSVGNVRLRVVFDSKWKNANQIGLMLYARQGRGYVFRLAVPPAPKRRAATSPQLRFWNLMEKADLADIEILRDGHLLRQRSVRINNLVGPDGQLVLEATAEGGRVRFRVGDAEPLAFEDIFPYTGGGQEHYGLLWPAGVPLVSLSAQRQPLPVQPGELEEGDELFAQQQWEEALRLYRRQAGLAASQQLRDRARYKEALCLLRLQRDDDAEAILESLAQTPDERLQLLAACQLWVQRLTNLEFVEADVIFEHLESRYSFEELALLVPEEQRRDILRRTYHTTVGMNLYRFSEEELRFLERAHAVAELLSINANPGVKNLQVWQLLRGYHAMGEIDKGIRLVRRYLASNNALGSVSIVQECSWLLRQRGQFSEAMRLINQQMGDRDREHAPPGRSVLLVERARIHAAAGNWKRARQDLDDFLVLDSGTFNYRDYSAACLLRGFLHERDGENEQALELWRRGNYETWVQEVKGGTSSSNLNGMAAAHALFLGSLSESLSDRDVSELVSLAFPVRNSGVTGKLLQQYVHIISPAVRGMARSERGREVIRQTAFQEVPLRQLLRDPVALLFLEVTQVGAADRKWTDEEADVISQFMYDMIDQYSREEVDMPQAVQLMLAWKGANNVFGWQGVAPSLSPEIRGPVAYILAHRYLKLGRPDDSRQFFETARDDAAEGSTLRKLAEQKLQKPSM